MTIGKGHHLRLRDYYIDYPIEEVTFRWDHRARVAYRRFYGDVRASKVPHDDRLWNDALLYGEEIGEATFRVGKPRCEG